MRRWASTACLIGLPCLLALLAYDTIAILIFHRGPHPFIPAHDLSRSVFADLGLAFLYMAVIPPRVLRPVSSFSPSVRRVCLLMLGLGLAWYDVMCAAASRLLDEPPGLVVSVVVLVLVPMLVAPWYVRWVQRKVKATTNPTTASSIN